MDPRKYILSIIRLLQSQAERQPPLFEGDQNILQQSRFFIRSMTWGLIVTTGFGISWLALAYTDEVVMVQGKIEPIGDVKEIQLPVGGVVQQILVRAGDRVKKGQILVVLEKETSEQNVRSLKAQLEQKKNQLKLKKLEKIKSYELIIEKIEILRERYFLEQRITKELNFLSKEGAVSEIKYLEQVQKERELLSEIKEQEKDRQLQQIKLDQQLEGLNSEIAQLKAKNTEADILLKYKSLHTPVDGVVFDLKPNTTGFVANSSDPIMKIVPFNELEADILIPSNKIGFVSIGMPAEISIDSFPANDFGTLKGEISSIGSDALPPDPKFARREYQFPATIRLKNQKLKLKNGKALPLQVGMSLQANIKLRRVTYMQLLLGGFKDKSDSLKRI